MKPVVAVLLSLFVAACGQGAPSADGVTFHRDIRPVVEQRCVSCHQPGGVGPFDFTDAASWADGTPTWGPAAAAAVAAGRMPPWLPSADCKELQDDKGLTEDERALFADWAANDHAAGDEADYVAPEPVTSVLDARRAAFGEPDYVLSAPEPYQIRADERPDDYRCIVVDHDFTEGTWIRGVEVRPDQKAFVHHLIVYQYDPGDEELVNALDAEDPDVGYACFGNPSANTVMAWAPGQNGEFLPDDVGRYVPAGAKWVLQIHYNALGVDPSTLPEDRTSVAIWESPTKPSRGVYTVPLPDTGIFLPAGDAKVVEREDFRVRDIFGELPFEVPLMGVMAHMHQLGTAIALRAERDGGDRACLLDIPRWDFNWQQTYYFPEDDWFPVDSSTTLKMTCEYDNSAANQIVVNGVARTPEDVGWGENTTDEMCLTYGLAVLPAAILER